MQEIRNLKSEKIEFDKYYKDVRKKLVGDKPEPPKYVATQDVLNFEHKLRTEYDEMIKA